MISFKLFSLKLFEGFGGQLAIWKIHADPGRSLLQKTQRSILSDWWRAHRIPRKKRNGRSTDSGHYRPAYYGNETGNRLRIKHVPLCRWCYRYWSLWRNQRLELGHRRASKWRNHAVQSTALHKRNFQKLQFNWIDSLDGHKIQDVRFCNGLLVAVSLPGGFHSSTDVDFLLSVWRMKAPTDITFLTEFHFRALHLHLEMDDQFIVALVSNSGDNTRHVHVWCAKTLKSVSTFPCHLGPWFTSGLSVHYANGLLVTAEPSGGIRLVAYFESWKLGLLYDNCVK